MTKALVKPELLKWARRSAKVSVEDAAKVVNVDAERIEQWEKGDDAPTVPQLRALAKKYHFPLAVFYLPEPPLDFAPLRDFRRLPNAQYKQDKTISPNLAFHIRNAHERRELALELYDDQRRESPPFPLKATLQDDPEAVGGAIRDFLNVDDDSQKKAAKQDRTFEFWRRRIEEHDILVFVISGPHYSVDFKEMRGFAIARPQLPVIVINGKDYSQGGKAFTLLHELTHIILGESAISNGATEELTRTPEEHRIERFCDAVAAAALMPARLIQSFPQVARTTGIRAWGHGDIAAIARAIGVGQEALVLRFVTLQRATWDFYRTQQARFEEERRRAADEKDKKAVAIKRPILLMSWNGRGFTRLVLRSYYDQRITLNDVSSYLGAKVKHIPALEHAAFQMAE
jgi:Zn-dependent peptidase ImmA (M78 family)/DNA-binding XRE family transcriptional regulator